MSEEIENKREKSVLQNPVVIGAIITGIVAALITGIFNYITQTTVVLLPIYATQTAVAEARLTAIALNSLTVTPTAGTLNPSKTISLPLPEITNTATYTPRPIIPTPLPGEERIIGGTPMIYIANGDFLTGSNDGNIDQYPIHNVYIDAFWIDKYEVSNALYKKCVDAKKCALPDMVQSHTRSSYYGNQQFNDFPVIYVSWDDAVAYCGWIGKRLPSEAEWEKAARGTDGRIYPWGKSFEVNKVNSGIGGHGDTVRVGNYPDGASTYGILDMAGNVWEWIADWYDSGYYLNAPNRNPKGPALGTSRVLRGGSWTVDVDPLRTSFRHLAPPTSSYDDVGFRCAQGFSPLSKIYFYT